MNFNYRHCRNETEVRSKLIVYYLLPRLGYAPNEWHEEATFRNIRLDFLITNQPIVANNNRINLNRSLIIETKSPRQNLDIHLNQFHTYLQTISVKYGVLTNGKDFRIYQRVPSPQAARGLFAYPLKLLFQCCGDEIEGKIEDIKALIGQNSLRKDTTRTSSVAIANVTKKTQVKTRSKMKTIAVYHNKGGVGKTTTVVNLAAALSKSGKKVLVIDLDSQANTTFATGLVKFEDEFDDYIKNANVYHVIKSSELHPISEVKITSDFCNPTIDIIPSHITLMAQENELNQLSAINFTLLSKLEEVKDVYDIVLIDTPPSLNLYARIALVSADYLLIPSDLKPFANQGLDHVKNFIKDINAAKKAIRLEALKIIGVLPCKIATHHKFIQSTLPKQKAKITDRYDLPLLNSVIFQREDVARCSDVTIPMGEMEIPDPKSILDYKPSSQSATEFKNLATEILTKIEA